jgi:hypothetical protein
MCVVCEEMGGISMTTEAFRLGYRAALMEKA